MDCFDALSPRGMQVTNVPVQLVGRFDPIRQLLPSEGVGTKGRLNAIQQQSAKFTISLALATTAGPQL